MTFSLLHFLASHPRNADMLKRALRGDADARRLFSYFGVTPTHLADIDEGAIARRSAAISVPRTVEVTAPDSCAVRLAEAEKTIKALEARLAEQTPPEPPKAYERDGMKPEHRIARIRRLFCLSDEWLESDLERLHADYRAMYRALDREKGSSGEAAIKALRDRAESAEASVQELRERLQAEIMAHDTTRSQVGGAPKPEQTPPEEVIVLGPWRQHDKGGDTWFRTVLGIGSYGAFVDAAGWCCGAAPDAWGAEGSETGDDGKVAADRWAREYGYILINAKPRSRKGTIGAWTRSEPYAGIPWFEAEVEDLPGRVVVSSAPKPNQCGWSIVHWGSMIGHIIAHGPQTGEEGKRYALAAAHALGLTGGDE